MPLQKVPTLSKKDVYKSQPAGGRDDHPTSRTNHYFRHEHLVNLRSAATTLVPWLRQNVTMKHGSPHAERLRRRAGCAHFDRFNTNVCVTPNVTAFSDVEHGLGLSTENVDKIQRAQRCLQPSRFAR